MKIAAGGGLIPRFIRAFVALLLKVEFQHGRGAYNAVLVVLIQLVAKYLLNSVN
jgi:hypothetical protein